MLSKSVLFLFVVLSVAFCQTCNTSEFIDSPYETIIGTLIETQINDTNPIDMSSCTEIDVFQSSVFYNFNSAGMNHLMIDHCNVLGHFVNVAPISFVVYKGSCENLVCVVAYADLCGINGGEFGIDLEQHTDYFIAVYGPVVDFIVDLHLGFLLKNDDCENAIEVSKGSLYTSSSAHATLDGSTFCITPSPNVWYSFTTSEEDSFALISFCRNGAEALHDNFISIMTGDDCSSATCVAFDDNSCGLAPEINVRVEKNTRYLFEIGTIGTKGEFTFYFDLLASTSTEEPIIPL
jgi:hypothetical protein